MKASLLVVVAGSIVFAACSSSNSAAPPGPTQPGTPDAAAPAEDAAADAEATGPLAAPPAGQGIQYEMQTTIPAGLENERCKFVTAPAEGMWITNEVIRYTPGSHHFILWGTSYTTIPTTFTDGTPLNAGSDGIFDCTNGPNSNLKSTNLVGGSQAATSPPILQNLPPGVAVHVLPGAILMMNLHILNATAASVDTDTRINLYTAPANTITTEAGIFFFYDPFIEVPAHAAASARMSCPVTSNITVVNGQSHMHARGLGGVANLVKTADDSMVKQIYVSHDWVNVPVEAYSPALTLTKGQSIDYQCNYQSQQDTTVYQGLKTTDEMCVFTGVYYPRDTKFETCSNTGNFNDLSTAATYIGTGTTTCGTALTCIAGSGNSLQGLTPCIVDSCPKAGIPLTAVLNCEQGAVSGTCASACGGGGSGCINCITSACGPQLSTCESSKCN